MDRLPILSSDEFPAHIPPVPAAPQKQLPRWRWLVAFCFIASFPILSTLVGAFRPVSDEPGPALPQTVPKLLLFGALELAIFAAFWIVPWLVVRPNRDELLLRWRGGWRPVGWGIIYFLVLRIGPIVLGMFLLMAIFSVAVMLGTKPADIQKAIEDYQRQNVHPERMISASALTTNPLYLLVVTTYISFVVAALREELWRTFTLLAADRVFPQQWTPKRRAATALVISSVIFGLGHYAVQGALGVVLTTLLGLVLGFAILQQRSIWPAVIAHGLFDATTFLLIPFVETVTKVK